SQPREGPLSRDRCHPCSISRLRRGDALRAGRLARRGHAWLRLADRGPRPCTPRSDHLANEPLVAALEELRLELLHRLHDDADDDENARAAEPERLHLRDVADERRHDRHDAEEERARARYLGYDA